MKMKMVEATEEKKRQKEVLLAKRAPPISIRMPDSTAKVSNLSLKATKRDIQEFFSFSGEISHVELQSEGDHSQVAFITFKDPEALNTALLLSGATIIDQCVDITAMEGFVPSGEGVTKAQDVVTSMLAKGYILGKDTLQKAKTLDEKHQWTAQAAISISTFDKRVGLSEKLKVGTSAVNETMRSVDDKYRVSEKTKVALAVAEQKALVASSALMKNQYVLTSASWLSSTLSKVVKVACEMGQKTMEKVAQSETNKIQQQGQWYEETADRFVGVGVSNLSEPATIPLSSSPNSLGYQSFPSS